MSVGTIYLKNDALVIKKVTINEYCMYNHHDYVIYCILQWINQIPKTANAASTKFLFALRLHLKYDRQEIFNATAISGIVLYYFVRNSNKNLTHLTLAKCARIRSTKYRLIRTNHVSGKEQGERYFQ